MFRTLKGLLHDRLRQQGIAEVVEAAQVTQALRQEVEQRFGTAAASGLRKVALRDDTLEVLATSGALASELRLVELELAEALKKQFPGTSYRLRIFG